MLAIVNRKNSFSERWIQYCQQHQIPYRIVNPYANDIISQTSDCNAFMWHFHQSDYRDMQFAKSLILSLEARGIRCFPNSNTCWHFDDKIAQKYLLEAINAPLVPSYIFFSKTDALKWVYNTTFPKVFKLKGGAGATNVLLANNLSEAKHLINQCFGRGFRQYRWREQYKETYRKYRQGRVPMRDLIRPLYYSLKRYPTGFDHYHGREIGYAYFQDFIPNNNYDIRVCVVGDKAFALKRYCREHDFRASGSGTIIYDKQQIDERCVRLAFNVNEKLKMQSVAFDFVFDSQNNPMIVEISYGYAVEAYDHCEGYWTSDMKWHKGTHFDYCSWMVDNIITS